MSLTITIKNEDIKLKNNVFLTINDFIKEVNNCKVLKKNTISYWDENEINNMGKISTFTTNSF